MNTETKPDNKAVKPKKHGLGAGGKILIAGVAGIAAFEGAGIGYDALKYKDEPLPITTMAEHPFGIGLPPQVEIIPSTFNPAAIDSIIGGNNSVFMTFAQEEQAAPPLWENGEKTLTTPLPILFRDNRTPTLLIQKVENSVISSLNVIAITDGLEEGDVIVSPFDGEIELYQGVGKFNYFCSIYQRPSRRKY